jgi:hypothetical protein
LVPASHVAHLNKKEKGRGERSFDGRRLGIREGRSKGARKQRRRMFGETDDAVVVHAGRYMIVFIARPARQRLRAPKTPILTGARYLHRRTMSASNPDVRLDKEGGVSVTVSVLLFDGDLKPGNDQMSSA